LLVRMADTTGIGHFYTVYLLHFEV